MANPFAEMRQVKVRDTEDLTHFGIPEGAVVDILQIVDDDHVRVRFSDGPANSFRNTRFEPVRSAGGRKDDSGKLDMTLLDDMPRALAAVVEVMQWAVEKKTPVPYERGSWLGVHADRYRAAMKRHDRDACQQSTEYTPPRFERDKETKLLHLAHIATSALMALENTIREMEATHAG